MPTRPVRTSSWIPCGRASSWKASSSSGVPVSSNVTVSAPRSTTRPLKASEVEISSARRSGRRAHLEQEQLPLDRLFRLQLGDAEHVHELVDLLLDLLQRVVLGVDPEGDARDAVALGRPDGERVDVEAAAREHRRDPRERARLVLEEDRDRVLHDVASTGSSNSTMSIAAAPVGIIGKHCSAGSTRQSITTVRLSASASRSAGSNSSSLSTSIPTPP